MFQTAARKINITIEWLMPRNAKNTSWTRLGHAYEIYWRERSGLDVTLGFLKTSI